MMKKNILLVLSALVLAFAAQANAGEVSVLGGLDMAKTSVSPEPTGSTSGGISKFTFGADYNHGFAPDWSLEVGLFYQNKGGKLTTGTTVLEGVGHSITVPVMARYSVIPQYLSVGAGIYGSYGMGDITETTTVGTAASTSESKSYDAAGFGKLDYGVVGGVRGSYPVAQGIEVIGDVRYYYGLKNVYSGTSTTTTIKNSDLALLVGARFAM